MKLKMFSGYIRNLKSLCHELNLSWEGERQELEKKVILKAWDKWGTDTGNHLYGAFSFAILNENTDELFCIRDQLGIEQMYYYVTDKGEMLYCSDIRTIRSNPEFRASIDMEALQTYIMFGYSAGEKTLYKGLRKLLPGNYLVFSKGTVQLHPYCKLLFSPQYDITEDEWCDRIEATAKTIIAEDIETYGAKSSAAFLSSGVDSSWLLFLCGAENAISVGYENAYGDETGSAFETAKVLGRSFRKKTVTPKDYFDALPTLCKGLELPLADASSPVFFLGCKEASRISDFCFSGEGPDEFFAGYKLHRRADTLALDGEALHFGSFGLLSEEEAGELLGFRNSKFNGAALVSDIYRDTAEGEHLSRLLAIDIKLFFEGDILFNLSRNAKANGITVTAPFADPRMLELSATIPSGLKLKDGQDKYIFRRTAARELPNNTAFREKKGFSVPVSIWMREEAIQERMASVLFGELSELFFDRKLLRKWWDELLSGDIGKWNALYGIYIFLIWYGSCYLHG